MSLDCFLAISAKFPPFLSEAMMALASASVGTRMWLARYSWPWLAATNLSYSALISASVTGFFFWKSSNSSRIRMVWRASSICAL
ncbi:hypothetical protein D3C78_1502370 [compost metagenome]